MTDIAIGRKEIMAMLHVANWDTVRKWKTDYKLPVRYLPNGKPMIIQSEVRTWMVTYSDLKKQESA